MDAVWNEKPKRKFNGIMKLENVKLKNFMNEKWIKMDEFDGVVGDQNVTGSSYKDKIDKVRKLISDGEGLLISDLSTIAWLFNLRGSDIEHQSVFYSYVYITKNSTKLFISGELSLDGVEICKYDDFILFLEQIEENTVVISGDCNAHIHKKLKKAKYTD